MSPNVSEFVHTLSGGPRGSNAHYFTRIRAISCRCPEKRFPTPLPDYGEKARADLSKEFASKDFVEHYLEGLTIAGLDIGDED